jgi:thermitase
MKKVMTAGFTSAIMGFGAITFAATGHAAAEAFPAAAATSSVQGQIIVKYRDKGAAASVLRQHGLSEGTGIGGTGAHVIKVPAGKESQLIQSLSRNPAVEYAEPDELVTAATADDYYFKRQYALHNEGQAFTNTEGDISIAAGKPDADIDAVEAWGLADAWGVATENEIKVAVLDSGVASDNPDITEKVTARANFTDGQTDEDNYGHGTHVAGIIAATHNSDGVAGVCPTCTILDVKVLNDTGYGSTSAIANGINWAVKNGAKVINMSLGQRTSSRTLEAAVNDAWTKGAVIVAAAGNTGTTAKIYPAAYPNVIAVAATDNNDAKASFSTYGAKWVDVAAPGANVYSTFPNHPFRLETQYGRSQGYDVANGTSMASPIVAGVVALAWGKNTSATNTSVRTKVESTADKSVKGTGTYWAHGRVNAHEAVK